MILQIEKVIKQFRDVRALNELSLDIPSGIIFGLLGPNGAGKTTLIRIITQIIKADEGKILFDGKPLQMSDVARVGYLPEERGLYPTMPVGEQLLYLARLKGLSKSVAKQRMNEWFERFDMLGWQEKKVADLSKGMQQKVQFVATLLHDPTLIILDEPFTGLDPLNTRLIKNEIAALRDRGVSVIFSTHRMEQVEEICQEIALIDKGRILLQGKVDDIKQTYKKNIFKLHVENVPQYEDQDWFATQAKGDTWMQIKLPDDSQTNRLLGHFLPLTTVKGMNEILPSLNDIFIEKVEGK